METNISHASETQNGTFSKSSSVNRPQKYTNGRLLQRGYSISHAFNWLPSFLVALELSHPKKQLQQETIQKTNKNQSSIKWIESPIVQALEFVMFASSHLPLGSQSDRWALEHSSLPFLGVPGADFLRFEALVMAYGVLSSKFVY